MEKFLSFINSIIIDNKNYFENSKKEIASKNLKLLKVSSLITFFLTVLFIILTPFIIVGWKISFVCILLPILMFIFFLIAYFLERYKPKQNTVNALCLLYCITLLGILIIIDTIVNSDSPASLFSSYLVALPVIFIFRYRIIISLIFTSDLTFIIIANNLKQGTIRQNDLFNAIFSFFLSVVVAVIVLSLRIEDNNAKQRYKKLSKTDYLTGVYNKNTCERLVSKYLDNRISSDMSALIVMDIDNFKTINDVYGHSMGDRILETFSRSLHELFGEHNIIGRIGGDEFMILLCDISDSSFVSVKCGQLQKQIMEIDLIDDYTVKCSIGAAIVKDRECSYLQMFQIADDALYEAKNSGKNHYVLRNYNDWSDSTRIKPTVILIDTDDVERRRLHKELHNHYEVKEAADENDAVNALEHLKERVSAVILEFYTGKIDSFKILKHIKSIFNSNEVSVVGIISEHGNNEQILKYGVSELITRPVNSAELINCMQDVIINKIRR